MSKFILASLVIAVVGLAGGGAYLACFNIPAPIVTTKVVLPDARFPQ